MSYFSKLNKLCPQHVTSDPLIVDDTAELDHILETGHIPEHALHVHPRIPRNHTEDESHRTDLESQTSFQRSEADDSFTRRKLRLVDTLGGTFSPKRPRTITTATTLSSSSIQHNQLPSVVSTSDASVRPSASLLASRPSNVPASTTRTDSSLSSSSATQKARLVANTAANACRVPEYDAPPARKAAPRQDWLEKRQPPAQSSIAPRELACDRNRSGLGHGLSIHLPDITGLTAAVASPRKVNVHYKDAQVGMPSTLLDADREFELDFNLE